MRPRKSPTLILLCLWSCVSACLPGCSGRSVGVPTDLADGSAGQDPDGTPQVWPDGSVPGPFCEGRNKIELDEVLVLSPEITSSQVVMDCCDGAVLHFHEQPRLGQDLVVMIRAMGGWVPGEFELTDEGVLVEASVFPAGGQPPEDFATLAGTLSTEWQGNEWDDPILVTLCGRVDAPGPFEGLRVWVNRLLVAQWGWSDRWGIWLLADSGIDAVEAATLPLDSLELETEPLVPLTAISYYSWSTHSVYWDVWFGPRHVLNAIGEVGVRGVPFVVKADGARIYLGAFFTALSSYAFDHPTIVVDNLLESHFVIEPGYPGGDPMSPDPRADPRIRQTLEEANKLAP